MAEGIDAQRIKIQVGITNSTEMNIYIYGGSSRWQATENVIPSNSWAEVGGKYKIEYEIGMLLIAYPNAELETKFGFEYHIIVEDDPNAASDGSEEGEEDGSST